MGLQGRESGGGVGEKEKYWCSKHQVFHGKKDKYKSCTKKKAIGKVAR